jgi:hypothetical protein
MTTAKNTIDYLVEKIETEMSRYPVDDSVHNVSTLMRIAQDEYVSKRTVVASEAAAGEGVNNPVIFEMFAKDVRESRANNLTRDVRHLFGFIDTCVYSDAQLETLAEILCYKYHI